MTKQRKKTRRLTQQQKVTQRVFHGIGLLLILLFGVSSYYAFFHKGEELKQPSEVYIVEIYTDRVVKAENFFSLTEASTGNNAVVDLLVYDAECPYCQDLLSDMRNNGYVDLVTFVKTGASDTFNVNKRSFAELEGLYTPNLIFSYLILDDTGEFAKANNIMSYPTILQVRVERGEDRVAKGYAQSKVVGKDNIMAYLKDKQVRYEKLKAEKENK